MERSQHRQTPMALFTQWALSKGFAQGAFWTLMVALSSCLNDGFTKSLGENYHGFQVTFLRSFFSMVTLLPFMIYFGKQSFYSSRIKVHFIRAGLLFAGIAPWSIALSQIHLTIATTLSFTVPLFILPLAALFLKEDVSLPRIIATVLGFTGVILTINPFGETFNCAALLLVGSAAAFATLDVINKKLVVDESIFAMLFYSSLIMSTIALIPGLMTWQDMPLKHALLFVCLGGGANIILFCLLKAFAAYDISALAPIRYTELLISAALGFVIFGEVPYTSTLLGAGLIIPSALFIARYELNKSKGAAA